MTSQTLTAGRQDNHSKSTQGPLAKDAKTSTGNNVLSNRLSIMLRILGAGALVFAMYTFLARGWQSGNDVMRYFMMLGHNGLLASIGLASGHYLREGKGARLLLTLALVSVPANFAILGAFIFSQSVPVDMAAYPNYVAWAVGSMQSALLTTAAALLVLAPLTLLSFTVLARSMSKRLSALFLLSNLSLLIPLRDPYLVGMLVLGLAVIVMLWSRKTALGEVVAKTREGMIALGLQCLPLSVLAGRSLWLYSLNTFLMTMLSLTVFFVLRQMALSFDANSKIRQRLNIASLLPVVSTTLLAGDLLRDLSILPRSLVLPLAVILSAGMVYDVAGRSKLHAGLYRSIAMMILVVGMSVNLLSYSSLLPALLCIFSGLALLFYGYQHQQRSVFTGGVIIMSTGAIERVYSLMHSFDLGSWASLTLLGVGAIITASVIESQAGNLKVRFSSWKADFKEWNL